MVDIDDMTTYSIISKKYKVCHAKIVCENCKVRHYLVKIIENSDSHDKYIKTNYLK